MKLKPFIALLLALLASCGMPEYVGAHQDAASGILYDSPAVIAHLAN